MESHPDRDNPEANLWFTRENGLVKPLAYGTVRMVLGNTYLALFMGKDNDVD